MILRQIIWFSIEKVENNCLYNSLTNAKRYDIIIKLSKRAVSKEKWRVERNGSSKQFTICLLDKLLNMWYNEWVVTHEGISRGKGSEEGILKIEQCTTSGQALESN